jgi:H+/Cl- antiporter ClcA
MDGDQSVLPTLANERNNMMSRMRELKTLGSYFLIAFITEVIASYSTWMDAPTDSLRTLYGGNFRAYEIERLIPWLIGFVLLGIMRLIIVKPTTQIQDTTRSRNG